MNKKQLAMGLFALGTSALPVTDRMIREAGNNEGAAISSKAWWPGSTLEIIIFRLPEPYSAPLVVLDLPLDCYAVFRRLPYSY